MSMYSIEYDFEGYYSQLVDINTGESTGEEVKLYRTAFVDETGNGFNVYETAEERAKANRPEPGTYQPATQSTNVKAWNAGTVVRTVTTEYSLTTKQPYTPNRAERRKNGKR